jgi:8-oxo-dGTP pyrophosphatase MutT (NUDIX family)
MKQLAILNPEHAAADDVTAYEVRNAARAVVMDTEKKIGLLHVANRGHYVLPGGKIETSEDREAALRRECREEIGCEIDILGEIGSVVEYRKMFAMLQTSYCYFARVVGEKGIPRFTENEKEKGFTPMWLSYDEALKTLEENNPTVPQARLYITPRDIILLKAAKAYMV